MLINVDKIILAVSNSGGRGQLEYFPDRADINMSWGFGPEQEGPHAHIPLLILHEDGRKKDNFTSLQTSRLVVGDTRTTVFCLCLSKACPMGLEKQSNN
jgi:hypothetical protein